MAIADKCQQHSFGGGIRPFGAEIVVCGMDYNRVVVYVTQPSGSIVECSSASNGVGVHIVGGESRRREKLKSLLCDPKSSVENDKRNAEEVIRERIKMTIDALMEVYDDDDEKSKANLLEEIDLVVAHSSKGVFRINGDMLKQFMSKRGD